MKQFSFFFTTSLAFSVLVVEMPSTPPVNVSIMTSIYTLEKLVLGEVHLPVISWLDPIYHWMGWATGIYENLEVV